VIEGSVKGGGGVSSILKVHQNGNKKSFKEYFEAFSMPRINYTTEGF